ncbi:hypothetical protein LDENG_00143620 [Lucifuga dentata]|nr:hypothetical protein LDENG_00143620 [Lucifuga dentata]
MPNCNNSSITELLGALCDCRLSGVSWKRHALGGISRESFRRTLRKRAYGALLSKLFQEGSTKGPASDPSATANTPPRNKVLMISFDLRVAGCKEEAERLEDQLGRLPEGTSSGLKEVDSILELLLGLNFQLLLNFRYIGKLTKMGCFECCIKCLGGVPYASLVATILCFSGVALFCGCGHVALTGTVTILESHFSKVTSDHAMLTDIIQLMQYVIYGIASFFFLYGIILLAEGFYTTSAVKELHSEFKTTICGRCISGLFVFLTYILGVAWLGVFGFSAVPVFLFYNMWSTCAAMRSPMVNLTSIDSICVDVRQYGIIPWNATPGKACGSTLSDICNTSEFYLSYHLYIVACAGAGATVIALLIYMMATTYNFAVLKFKSREDCCTKF